MCDTVLIPCNKDHTASVGLVDVTVFAWKAAKVAWWMASNFAVGVAVIAAWTAPRVWRLTRTAYRAGRCRWLTRTVVLSRQPVAALPEQPTAMTLRDLMQKQEANAR